MATYDELLGQNKGTDSNPDSLDIVRDWANRDSDVLSDSQIKQALRWGADKCYRKLRIPSLEISREFIVEESDFVSSEFYDPISPTKDFLLMPVPQDLIDMIHIRSSDGYVFNEKLDRRSFFDAYALRRTDNYWTRLGDEYFLGGQFSEGESIFIHYYRRLPALDSTYLPLASTWNENPNFFTVDADQSGITADDDHNSRVLWFPDGTDATTALTATAQDEQVETDDFPLRVSGTEAAHWLRDENERILIFGALMEVFAYLNEPEQLARYTGMFGEEIAELNREETMRRTKGGNVQVNYTSCLL